MRVLICGGRDFTDKKLFHKTMCEIDPTTDEQKLGNPNLVIIHGGAKGADLMADEWAVVHWKSIEEYKADWGRYGRGAGPKRNQEMIDGGKPDLVVAFPGGRGTADMVRRAKKAGIEVKEISYDINN